jgi:hypothetical protein
MTASPTGDDLRRWAAQCAEKAQHAKTPEERTRLLRMQASVLELAKTQDWLDGKSPSGLEPNI